MLFEVKGQLGYVLIGQEGSVEINSGQMASIGSNYVNCNYALQVKGQLEYVLMGQEGSVQIGSTSQWPVRICSYGSIWVSWGQQDPNWGQLHSCSVRRDLKKINQEDLSEWLGDSFYERNVIWLNKQLCLVREKQRG